MKNITKFFGACAAVALFSACSSEEDIATAEGLVPEGMKKVSVTINEQLFADETGKKRVSMDKNGNFTWNSDASIAVVYEGQGKTQIYMFEGDNSVINDGVTGNFKGEIPFDVWLNMTPTHVYSEHTGNFTNTASVDEYTQVKTNQENAEDLWNGSDAICIDRPTENYSDFKYDLHLHGVPDYSEFTQDNVRVSTFHATLSLDVAAFVHIDKEDLPGADYKNGNWYYYITVEGQGYAGQTYTISCKKGNFEAPGDSYEDWMPTDGLSFFVKIPEGGIVKPQITVRGEEEHNEPITFTTKGGKPLEGAKRYKLENPNATKGTAIARIGSEDVKVPWVQLWAGGPKFATRYVGTSSATEKATERLSLEDSQKTGSEYVWGANWKTPSISQLEGLLDESLVSYSWTYYKGVEGILIKGITKGYESNELFFPNECTTGDYNGFMNASSDAGTGGYGVKIIDINCDSNYREWSKYSTVGPAGYYLIRPVLAE